jgi:ABC-type antimicrobial peptide transport system permease subunit
MATLLRDVRFGLRTLTRARFVTALAILAFALGIGVTSAVFSIFNGVLLKPLPFPKPEQIVVVFDTQPACSTCPASYPKFIEWKTRNTVFSAIGGATQASFTVTGAGDPIRVNGAATTASLADVFGVAPVLGRWYSDTEDQFGGPNVVVLAHELWYEVVGVIGDVRSMGLAQRTPYEFYRTIDQDSFNAMTVVARTGADDPTSVIPAARQIVRSLDDSLPLTMVRTMDAVVADSVGQPRLMSALSGLFGTLAGLLAMIGVYGVMAYNVRRQRREFGIRLALGADAARVRNLVVGRGLLLASIGVTLGAAGAWLLSGVLTALLHDVKPTDTTVFAATAAAVLVVATLASYLPARAAARVDPMVVLRDT